MSIPDYPLWDDLILKLIKGCEYGEPLEDGLSKSEITERLKTHDERKYWKTMRSAFARLENPRSIHRYHILARIPFASYITTNFDPLLLDTLSLHCNITYSQYPWLPTGQHGKGEVFFVHGRLDPDSHSNTLPEIVFAESEYVRAYDTAKTKLHTFLHSTLTEQPICFFGCGLADEYLKNVLRICKSINDELWGAAGLNRPYWFAAVDQHHEVPPKFEDEFGIRVVKYPVSEGQYVGLDELLRFLARANQPQMRKPTDGGAKIFLPRSGGPR